MKRLVVSVRMLTAESVVGWAGSIPKRPLPRGPWSGVIGEWVVVADEQEVLAGDLRVRLLRHLLGRRNARDKEDVVVISVGRFRSYFGEEEMAERSVRFFPTHPNWID